MQIACGISALVVSCLLHGAPAAAMIPRAGIDLLLGVGHMLHRMQPEAVLAVVGDLASEV